MAAKTSHVDALIAEVEECCPPDVVAKAKSGPGAEGVTSMPPGWEDMAMQFFLFLLKWWKSRSNP